MRGPISTLSHGVPTKRSANAPSTRSRLSEFPSVDWSVPSAYRMSSSKRRKRTLPAKPTAVPAALLVLTLDTRPAAVPVILVWLGIAPRAAGGSRAGSTGPVLTGGAGGAGGGGGGGGTVAIATRCVLGFTVSAMLLRTASYSRVTSGGKINVSGWSRGARTASRRNTAIAESGRPR